MIGKLRSLLGRKDTPAPTPRPPYAPYGNDAANATYNLLFCDAPDAFRPQPGQAPAPWQAVLFGDPVRPDAVATLAGDETAEGRVRMLAYGWLRANGHEVAAKRLLGTIVEVPLAGGLDVLAAFSEGGVRYINQTGRLGVFEGVESLRAATSALLAASQAVVDRIGPWDKTRLPPPGRDRVRLSFLVSDGLYFGDGEMSVMSREALGGPVIARAGELLQLVVATATK
jgi:hypothetical protein